MDQLMSPDQKPAKQSKQQLRYAEQQIEKSVQRLHDQGYKM
jgi:biotin operon repressor